MAFTYSIGSLLPIIARCYDNHSALLMHKMSSGPGFSTRPQFRHGDHGHHDETEAGLDCVPSDQSKRNKFCLSEFSKMAAMSTGSAKLDFAVYWENGSHELVSILQEEEKRWPAVSADLRPTFASGLYFQTKPLTCGLIPIPMVRKSCIDPWNYVTFR